MKNIIYKVIIIIIIASIMGLVKNHFDPKGLPFIYTKQIKEIISNDSLFMVEIDSDFSNLDKTITYEQVLIIVNNPEFIIIDARNDEQFAENHIKGAINISPYEDSDLLLDKIISLPQEKKIMIYCDGGDCDSSHKLAEDMLDLGITNVFIYSGGWEDWDNNKQNNTKDNI